jgi:hypothetical protein
MTSCSLLDYKDFSATVAIFSIYIFLVFFSLRKYFHEHWWYETFFQRLFLDIWLCISNYDLKLDQIILWLIPPISETWDSANWTVAQSLRSKDSDRNKNFTRSESSPSPESWRSEFNVVSIIYFKSYLQISFILTYFLHT